MRIPVRGLKVIDDLPFVPDMVAGGEDVNAHLEEIFSQRWRDAKAGRSVLPVGENEINGMLFN